MAKFAFIVPPLTGHVNPTLSIGYELLQRAHEVAWISPDTELWRILPPGGILLPVEYGVNREEKEKQRVYLDTIRKRSTYGLESLKFLYEEVLTPLNTYMHEGINTHLDGYRPDVVISDHQVFAGSVSAYQKGIPYATSVTAQASIKIVEALPKLHEWEGEQIKAFQAQAGITVDERLDCSKALTLVYTSQLFFGSTPLPAHYRFVGPAILDRKVDESFNWELLERNMHRPKILVSIGTTFDHAQKKAFFDKVVEAFEHEEVFVVVVSDPGMFERIPENFAVYRHIPQVELLPFMQLVVSHGGNNTVCETLLNGIPLVVIPIAYDQSDVAGCVVRNEAGIRLNFNRFKGHHLREAARTILGEERYYENARRIKKSFEEAGGAGRAADYLERMIPG